MENAILKLTEALERKRSDFNNINNFSFTLFQQLKEEINRCIQSIELRSYYSFYYSELIRHLDIRKLQYGPEEITEAHVIKNDCITIEIKNHKDFSFMFNTLVDNYLFNVSSTLDILGKMSNYVYNLRENSRKPSFSNLAYDFINNSVSDSFSSFILSNYYTDSRNTHSTAYKWINYLKFVRNYVTHEGIFEDNKGVIKFKFDEQSRPQRVYYEIDSNYFTDLPSSPDNDLRKYCEYLYEKLHQFIKESCEKLAYEIDNHPSIPF